MTKAIKVYDYPQALVLLLLVWDVLLAWQKVVGSTVDCHKDRRQDTALTNGPHP